MLIETFFYHYQQYLLIFHMSCKMVIIKNKGFRVIFSKVEDNYLYLKDVLFVFIAYLPCVTA